MSGIVPNAIGRSEASAGGGIMAFDGRIHTWEQALLTGLLDFPNNGGAMTGATPFAHLTGATGATLIDCFGEGSPTVAGFALHQRTWRAICNVQIQGGGSTVHIDSYTVAGFGIGGYSSGGAPLHVTNYGGSDHATLDGTSDQAFAFVYFNLGDLCWHFAYAKGDGTNGTDYRVLGTTLGIPIAIDTSYRLTVDRGIAFGGGTLAFYVNGSFLGIVDDADLQYPDWSVLGAVSSVVGGISMFCQSGNNVAAKTEANFFHTGFEYAT